jgi:hypothetical protein
MKDPAAQYIWHHRSWIFYIIPGKGLLNALSRRGEAEQARVEAIVEAHRPSA